MNEANQQGSTAGARGGGWNICVETGPCPCDQPCIAAGGPNDDGRLTPEMKLAAELAAEPELIAASKEYTVAERNYAALSNRQSDAEEIRDNATVERLDKRLRTLSRRIDELRATIIRTPARSPLAVYHKARALKFALDAVGEPEGDEAAESEIAMAWSLAKDIADGRPPS
jgi:hypothetical protein